MEKLFDLNMEKVLEHWGLEHALREIIANALDEQALSHTQDILLSKDETNRWHIRDYGRGLQNNHFTQNENEEKLISPNLIGKFGVGLKDALAVFDRYGIKVEMISKYAKVSLQKENKHGFDIKTLHAVFNPPDNEAFVGTEFIFDGVKDTDIKKAQSLFLRFSGSTLLEKTQYGEVFSRGENFASLYINGVQIATEENFMFSYNITSLSAQMKKAINRERSNVGRTAYSDSVKKILTQCSSDNVLISLVNDLSNVTRGTSKDESSWIDVSSHAVKRLNSQSNVVFFTPEERAQLTNQDVEILKESGKEMTLITDNVKNKLGSSITTFANIKKDYNKSFNYVFIEPSLLNDKEKNVFETRYDAINFLKSHNYKCDIPILISETIRINEHGEVTDGVFEPEKKRIIIKRSALVAKQFLAVLLHEFSHYISGASDNTRVFENTLTELLGLAMNKLILAAH